MKFKISFSYNVIFNLVWVIFDIDLKNMKEIKIKIVNIIIIYNRVYFNLRVKNKSSLKVDF